QSRARAGQADALHHALQISDSDAGVGDSKVKKIRVALRLNGDLATLRLGLETVLDCILDNRLERQGRNRRGESVGRDLELVPDTVIKADLHYREIFFNKINFPLQRNLRLGVGPEQKVQQIAKHLDDGLGLVWSPVNEARDGV